MNNRQLKKYKQKRIKNFKKSLPTVDLIHSFYMYCDWFWPGCGFGQINFNFDDKIFLPATNLDIVKRVMNNLIYALHITGEKKSAKNLLGIVDIL